MKQTHHCWYSTSPIGHTTLAGTVSRMCKAAGVGGFKTNHSLRATAATRLYQAGIDEQLIMEKTGHHSLEGVRSYKRTNNEQHENLSDILSLKKKKCTSSALVPFSGAHTSTQPAPIPNETSATVPSTNIIMPKQQAIHPDNLKEMFTFNSCTDVNIHIHF